MRQLASIARFEGRVFLSAEWRDLVMLNYAVDPSLLKRFVPSGTELDSFAGSTFVSLVGFRFLRTKLFGSVIAPFHSNFDEVNLRFYVRRDAAGELRRGVVFIREVVPRRLIAWLARFSYDERYTAHRMRHTISRENGAIAAAYAWQYKKRWCTLSLTASGPASLPVEGSLEQFITGQYWGYSMRSDGGSLEYRVAHDPWRIRASDGAGFDGDAGGLYGVDLARVMSRSPDSALIAEGSPVRVFRPNCLR